MKAQRRGGKIGERRIYRRNEEVSNQRGFIIVVRGEITCLSMNSY